MTSAPKKLLILSSDRYPPFRVDVKDLFGQELCKRGYKIDWILQSEKEIPSPLVEEWGRGKVWVGRTNTGGKWYQRLHKHLLNIMGDMRIFRIDLSEYDAVQVKDKTVAALFAMLALRSGGVKFIYWLSYPFPEAALHSGRAGTARYPFYNLFRGHVQKFLLYKVIMSRADHIFVQSDQMKRDIEKEGISPEKMTPVPMGISDDKLPALSDSGSENPNQKKIILYLGTLIKVRRMDFVVRVFSRVKQIIPDVALYFVGGGMADSDIDVIKDEMKACGLDEGDVLITGFLPIKEAWEYVKKADVCLSPFYPTPILNSTSPTKLIEYMSFQKPVVANEHPEQKKVLEESGAGICVPYDEQRFADAISEILGDPEMAVIMGKKGRQYVEENRTYSRLAEMVDQVYEKILAC